MARRAIRGVFLELASFREELNVIKQRIRVSHRPRLGLDQLVLESPNRHGLNPNAPVFFSTLAEELLGAIPSSDTEGPSMAAVKPESCDNTVDQQSSLEQYYKGNFNFKQVDIFSLSALKGRFWERLPEDHALDRVIQSYHKRDFVNMSRLMGSFPSVNDRFCKILLLFI